MRSIAIAVALGALLASASACTTTYDVRLAGSVFQQDENATAPTAPGIYELFEDSHYFNRYFYARFEKPDDSERETAAPAPTLAGVQVLPGADICIQLQFRDDREQPWLDLRALDRSSFDVCRVHVDEPLGQFNAHLRGESWSGPLTGIVMRVEATDHAAVEKTLGSWFDSSRLRIVLGPPLSKTASNPPKR